MSVNKDGNLALGVNDKVFSCTEGMQGFPDDCEGGASSGGTKPGELGMDTRETAEVTEVLVGADRSDPAEGETLSGVVKDVEIFNEVLTVEDIAATAPSRAPTSWPTASPSRRTSGRSREPGR